MSEQPATAPGVPEWDLADRMRKALRHASVTGRQMATYLGVNEATVSTWINGRIHPSTQTLRLWAVRCGVPYEWLKNGRIPSSEGHDRLGPQSVHARSLRPFRPLLTRAAA